jgi:hypothetical protein
LNPSSARVQAGIAAGLAVVLGGAWLLFGTPVRVRWIVARGAPPAPAHASATAADDLRTLGSAARAPLASLFLAEATPFSRKAWVASVLLRAPFYEHAVVEGALASPHKPTARAAAFALMDGEEFLARGGAGSFQEAVARVTDGKGVTAKNAPLETWDPAPAIPVLVEWIRDGSDPDAAYAALLLGKIPPGDKRVRDALLGAVEEAPGFLGKDAGPDAGRRKIVVVDALQSLLAWAKDDPETAARVAKVVAWIEESGNGDAAWDIQTYGLRLFEVARGRGVDPALLRTLSKSRNSIVRQRLAHTLENTAGAVTGELLRELVGDEVPTVRRAAIYTLRKRKDPMLLDLLPYLLEDAHIYCRADTLKSVGELRGVVPDRIRSVVPVLVACLEDPWPGPPIDPASPLAPYFAGARAEVVEGAAISLYMITFQCPGFVIPAPDGGKPELAILDNRKRSDIAGALSADPAKRKEVADEWHRTVPAWPETNRVPALVQRLEDRDPECILRACRELARITKETTGIPESLLVQGKDDTAARNVIREMRKKGEWAKVVEGWKAKR